MNRHVRRAQAKLLESHDRMASAAAKQGFADWRQAKGFVGEDAMENVVSALQGDADFSDAQRETEARATDTAALLLRQYEIRMTEQERERYFLAAALASTRLFLAFATEVRDYCAEMAAIGDEMARPAVQP